MVKTEMEKLLGDKIDITLKNIDDFRNYKVTIDKAKTYLGFEPQYKIKDIVEDLYQHKACFEDYSNGRFYNIKVFEKLNHKKVLSV
jgi:nucleoside-diphosphate-sugar epimerase